MSYSCGGPNIYFRKKETPANEADLMPSVPGMPATPLTTITPTSPAPTTQIGDDDPSPAPGLIPDAPSITVPPNPLLPPGYEEIIDYNSVQYLNGFLRTQIGRYAIIDFLIGSNSSVTKSGILVAVGLNYVILQDVATSSFLTCDFFTIKFVSFPY